MTRREWKKGNVMGEGHQTESRGWCGVRDGVDHVGGGGPGEK